jgi:proteasome accessory factor B
VTVPTKLQRWLDVVSYLAARRLPVSTEELWANVPAYAPGLDGTEKQKQTVRRMFERDKDELRDIGIPVETVQYTINYGFDQVAGYRLAKRDFHLPYVRLLREAEGDAEHDADRGDAPARSPSDFELTEAEAGAALDGLRELAAVPAFPLASAARSAFRKLAFDLDPELVGETPVAYAEDPETAAARDAVRVLSDALRRRKAVAFRYRSMTSDREEDRAVHPYGLLFQHGRWYLVAHDVGRDAVRMYRAGRMSGVTVEPKSPGTPDYEIPADFALDAYAGRKAWELGADEAELGVRAAVRFRFPRSLWAERNGHGELIEEGEEGEQLRRFVIHRRDPFLRWVLSLAGDARLESPDDLAAEFRAMARKVAALHGAGAGLPDSERASDGPTGARPPGAVGTSDEPADPRSPDREPAQ